MKTTQQARNRQAHRAMGIFRARYFGMLDMVHMFEANANDIFMDVTWHEKHGRIWIDYDGKLTESSI